MFSDLFKTLEHLPVNTIASDVASAFLNNNIPIVTSETGSGKTMLIPAACALAISEYGEDDIVYVLEPSRYLVMNAASNLRSILGEEKRDLVGYVMSRRNGEEYHVGNKSTRIVFATVGWALKAGLISHAKNIILDEAHETSIDLSITKAILHNRVSNGDAVRLAILSATIDVSEQLEYWGPRCREFFTKGSAFPLDFRHVIPDTGYDETHSLCKTIESFIVEKTKNPEDKVGLLVFVPGVGDIEDVVAHFESVVDRVLKGFDSSMFRTESETDLAFKALLGDLEIATIHGKSSDEEREAASAMPTKRIKILVGTNVIEQGISHPWVNSGISTGTGNVSHSVNSVKRLVREDLPAWRIVQQQGRVNRFGPGTFILHSKKALEERPNQAIPEIVRTEPHDLVLHLASEELSPEDMKFSRREQVDEHKLMTSGLLLRSLDLIETSPEGKLRLTSDGYLTASAPVGPRARAALAEAVRMNMLRELLPLIAMIDMKDIRHAHNKPIYFVQWRKSDLVAQTIAAAHYMKVQRESSIKDLKSFAKNNNISTAKMWEYDQVLDSLERLVRVSADFSFYLRCEEEDIAVKLDMASKRVLFRAFIDSIYSDTGVGIVTSPKTSDTTFVNTWAFIENRFGLAGEVRRIEPKMKTFSSRPFYVLEHITVFTKEDFERLLSVFGRDTIFNRMDNHESSSRALKEFYSERKSSSIISSSISRSSSLSFSAEDSSSSETSESAMALALKKAGIG